MPCWWPRRLLADPIGITVRVLVRKFRFEWYLIRSISAHKLEYNGIKSEIVALQMGGRADRVRDYLNKQEGLGPGWFAIPDFGVDPDDLAETLEWLRKQHSFHAGRPTAQ